MPINISINYFLIFFNLFYYHFFYIFAKNKNMIDREEYFQRVIDKLDDYNVDDIDYDYLEEVIYKAIDDEVDYYKKKYEEGLITENNEVENEWEIVDDWDMFDNDILTSVLNQLGI